MAGGGRDLCARYLQAIRRFLKGEFELTSLLDTRMDGL